MLKILIIIPSLKGKGGVAHYWNNLISHFEKSSDFEFTVFEMGGQSGKGITHYLGDQLKLRKLLKNNRFDLAHVNPSLDFKSFVRDGLFISQLNKHKVPFMITFHGWEKTFAEKIAKNYLKTFKRTYLKAQLINVLSKEFVSIILSWGYTNPVFVQTTCVKDELIEKISIERKKVDKGSKIHLLYISRIVKEKGVLETIKAYELLTKNHDIELNIAGDGPFLEHAKKYVSDNNVPNVNFLGYINGKQKEELFQKSQIMCFPSYYPEGLPVSILEGISTGCLLVCSNIGGIKDIFIDNKMGSISSCDVSDITEKIDKWLSKPEEINSVIENNHKHGIEYFMAKNISQNILNQYSSLCE